MKFCTNCGAAVDDLPTPAVEQPPNPATPQADAPTEQPVAANGGGQAEFKFSLAKLIGSLIFGIILSVVTTFLMSFHVVQLFALLGAWIIIGALSYLLVEVITHNKVFAFLGGLAGGGLLGTFLVSSYTGALEAADTRFDLAVVIAVVAVIYTFFIFLLASVENTTPNGGDQQQSDGNPS